MAIKIDNLANITYNYGNSTDTALSNVASTQLNENYGLSAVKTARNSVWRPSENLTFDIEITNTGIEPLYGVSIQDNLDDNLLIYVTDSAIIYKNNIITDIIPTATSPLTFIIPNTLEPGEKVLVSYVAKVIGNIDDTITNITNEANVVGHEISISGPTITVDPVPTVTITKAQYAEVRITKSVDKDIIFVGDKLTYTFTLENSGNTNATNVIIEDDLPEKFVIESIKSETNGVETIFETTDYSLDENNKLILPTSISKTISVPAKTTTSNGITTVTIVGQITA